MKKTAIVFLTHLFIKVCIAQQLILPGNNTLNPSLLKPGNYSMAYYFKKDGQYTEIGTYNVNVFLENQKLNVNTSLSFHNSSMVWNDGFVANIHSFTPVSSYIERDQFSVHLNYSNTITGEYIPKKNGKKKTINIAIPNNYFNISFYPYIIRMLPLETGYKATIPVYDYEASDNNRLYNIVIKEVKSNIYQSTFTGEYKVWKVSVFEESTGHYFDYYIDKQTRRLWEVQILSKNGDFIALYDKEIDFNPFKNKFNKEETYNLVNNGNATIKGVAYGEEYGSTEIDTAFVDKYKN